jgi:hypothetical protein
MIVSTTSTINVLAIVAGVDVVVASVVVEVGGGGVCTKSPVGTLPAKLLTETIMLNAIASKMRFI